MGAETSRDRGYHFGELAAISSGWAMRGEPGLRWVGEFGEASDVGKRSEWLAQILEDARGGCPAQGAISLTGALYQSSRVRDSRFRKDITCLRPCRLECG
jgi:hypothetical protein